MDISRLVQSRDSESPPPGNRSTTSTASSGGGPKLYTTEPLPYTPASLYESRPNSVPLGKLADNLLPSSAGVSFQHSPTILPSPQTLLDPSYGVSHSRTLYPGRTIRATAVGYIAQPIPNFPNAFARLNKRSPPPTPLTGEPAKKATKWADEETQLNVELRRTGMKWEDIAKRLPGRSATSCRLRYQNYSEKKQEWNDERKNTLARLYIRFRKDIWDTIGKEMGLPSRAVEDQIWAMGPDEIAKRAKHPGFLLDRARYHQSRSPPPAHVFAFETPTPAMLNTPYSNESDGFGGERRRGDSAVQFGRRHSIQSAGIHESGMRLPPLQGSSSDPEHRRGDSELEDSEIEEDSPRESEQQRNGWYSHATMTPPSLGMEVAA